MNNQTRTTVVLLALSVAFLALAVVFGASGRVPAVVPNPLVDTNFLDTATVRRSYAKLVKLGEDVTDFECYTCHEKGKSPPLNLDPAGKIIVAVEHADIVMGHGSHGRNNNCYNCHDDKNLTLMQTRDGRKVSFAEGQLLCGSCHGPTYRDWEAGVHGRTSGYWNRSMGAIDRKLCMDCHNPHAPKFPGRKPAPAPRMLRPLAASHAGGAAVEPAASEPPAASESPGSVPAQPAASEPASAAPAKPAAAPAAVPAPVTATNRVPQPAH